MQPPLPDPITPKQTKEERLAERRQWWKDADASTVKALKTWRFWLISVPGVFAVGTLGAMLWPGTSSNEWAMEKLLDLWLWWRMGTL